MNNIDKSTGRGHQVLLQHHTARGGGAIPREKGTQPGIDVPTPIFAETPTPEDGIITACFPDGGDSGEGVRLAPEDHGVSPFRNRFYPVVVIQERTLVP